MAVDKSKKPKLRGNLANLAKNAKKVEDKRNAEVNGDKNGLTEPDIDTVSDDLENETLIPPDKIDEVGGNDIGKDVVADDESESSDSGATIDDDKTESSKRARKSLKGAKKRKISEVFEKDPELSKEKLKTQSLYLPNAKLIDIVSKAGGAAAITVLNNIVKQWEEDNRDEIEVLKKKYIDDMLG